MSKFMQAAITQAHKAYQLDEVPVGVVIVKDNHIIATAHNEVEKYKNPILHAEIIAIQQACRFVASKILNNCDIYVTLEPCAMCAQAIAYAKIKRLFFGAYDCKNGGVEFGAKIFSRPTCHHRPEYYGGILQEECRQILQKFFIMRRV